MLNVIEALALNTLLLRSPDHKLGRCDPRAVPGILSGPPRRGGRSCRDRRVQPIDSARAFPTPPTTRSVKAASAREVENAMEEGPHGRENRPKRTLKLLVMFGNCEEHRLLRGDAAVPERSSFLHAAASAAAPNLSRSGVGGRAPLPLLAFFRPSESAEALSVQCSQAVRSRKGPQGS